MSDGQFPSRLSLALKALSMSRGRLAAELAVDKSVISRWLNGRQTPSGENLANLTTLIAVRRPSFTLLDWETDEAAFAAKLVPADGHAAREAESWLPESVLQEARSQTALRGEAYEGFWRSTRPAIGQPGRFLHDIIMIGRAPGGLLSYRLQVEDMRFDGWLFPTQTQLFCLAVDAATGIFIFSVFNAVLRQKAEVLDGLTLTIQRVGGGAPVAGAILLERCGDLTGEPGRDEATYQRLMNSPALAPEGSIPDAIREHLLRDFGPSALAQGGAALLMMPFAGSMSRGPIVPPERPPARR